MTALHLPRMLLTTCAVSAPLLPQGCLAAVALIKKAFPALALTSVSGNLCADKKAAAINWIEGRGKSVVCEARIPAAVVRATLKVKGRETTGKAGRTT